MSEVALRVNGALLMQQGANKLVRIIGRVLQLDENQNKAIIETCDKMRVTVWTNNENQAMLYTGFVEIVGQVQSDHSIREQITTGLGTAFDLDAHQEIILLMSQFPDLF